MQASLELKDRFDRFIDQNRDQLVTSQGRLVFPLRFGDRVGEISRVFRQYVQVHGGIDLKAQIVFEDSDRPAFPELTERAMEVLEKRAREAFEIWALVLQNKNIQSILSGSHINHWRKFTQDLALYFEAQTKKLHLRPGDRTLKTPSGDYLEDHLLTLANRLKSPLYVIGARTAHPPEGDILNAVSFMRRDLNEHEGYLPGPIADALYSEGDFCLEPIYDGLDPTASNPFYLTALKQAMNPDDYFIFVSFEKKEGQHIIKDFASVQLGKDAAFDDSQTWLHSFPRHFDANDKKMVRIFWKESRFNGTNPVGLDIVVRERENWMRVLGDSKSDSYKKYEVNPSHVYKIFKVVPTQKIAKNRPPATPYRTRI